MSIWDDLRKMATERVDEIRNDPRVKQSLRDAEMAWREIEREVALIRQQLKENATPVVDDTAELKSRLDAFRQARKPRSESEPDDE